MSTDISIAEPLTPPSARTRYVSEEQRVTIPEREPNVLAGTKTETQSTVAGSVEARSLFTDYVQLTKPRIVTMILVTTVASAMIAAGGAVPWLSMIYLLIGTAMVAGAAGAANQIWEREIDCKMTRTASRPLPGERMTVAVAVVYTAMLLVGGTSILYFCFSASPAIAGLATWLLYVMIYTPMKTRTSWNTTVGAVAGALPVMIGYTAVGGESNDWTGWLLVAVLAAWQYPHFMAIAWLYRKQYAEAGFCMSTTVDPSGRSAAAQSIAGSIAILLCSVMLCLMPGGTAASLVASLLVFAACYPMLRDSIQFTKQRNDQTARKLLRSSLLVLPAVLAIITVRSVW